LELFFIDGTPEGMLTAEIFNWTGHVLMTPRIRLAEALQRREARHTGVYILIGTDEGSSLTKAYIGEGEDIAERIKSHDATRDWWTHAVLISSTANSLNKAHVKYLESRLVEEARRAGSMVLENGNTPPRPSLSESARANMEQFVAYLLTVLPAIRIDGFLVRTRSQSKAVGTIQEPEISMPKFEIHLANGEVAGTAILDGGEFVIQPGSIGRPTWIGVEHNYQKLFDEVVKSGAYVIDGSRGRFVKAYAFSSPSAAGAVLNGRATAGPVAWTVAGEPSKTYKDWENELLNR